MTQSTTPRGEGYVRRGGSAAGNGSASDIPFSRPGRTPRRGRPPAHSRLTAATRGGLLVRCPAAAERFVRPPQARIAPRRIDGRPGHTEVVMVPLPARWLVAAPILLLGAVG